jgi:hypothetical protein
VADRRLTAVDHVFIPPEVRLSAGISIASGFFTSAAAGILGALLLLPFPELRRFFFALNATLAFAMLCLAAPFRLSVFGGVTGEGMTWGAMWTGSLASGLAMVLVITYVSALYLPAGRQAKGWLRLATASALVATAADGWLAARGGAGAVLFSLNALAAAALLGSVIVAMILGHWYLVRWRLSVDHLVRLARVLGGAIGVRAALVVCGLLVLGSRSSRGLGGYLASIAIDRGFFFWQRILFGLIGPAIFAVMVYQTARIRSTQSATGILYIATIFVLIGEFLARFLVVHGAGPL